MTNKKETILETFIAKVSGKVRNSIFSPAYYNHPVEVQIIHGGRHRQDIYYKVDGHKATAAQYYGLKPVRVS
jgi:hypothetical protein